MSIDARYVAESVINNRHGWAVTEQFTDTFDGGESLDEQNYNALEMVSSTLRELLSSDVLVESYELDELKRYAKRLEDYLSDM